MAPFPHQFRIFVHCFWLAVQLKTRRPLGLNVLGSAEIIRNAGVSLCLNSVRAGHESWEVSK
jgi:hypothetical protein